MKDRTNDQPGAQRHAEGEYGDQARERNQERLQERIADTDDDRERTSRSSQTHAGKHRIYEDREQHDEADKNSEKNRLARDQEEGRAADRDEDRT